jgi:hypothetical protein
MLHKVEQKQEMERLRLLRDGHKKSGYNEWPGGVVDRTARYEETRGTRLTKHKLNYPIASRLHTRLSHNRQ